MMQGRRLPDGEISGSACFEPGVYGRIEAEGDWHACTPSGMLANLRAHDVVEHEDGTITASPSILVSQSNVGEWHGYLERGVWREC
jgi:hypothetical protein